MTRPEESRTILSPPFGTLKPKAHPAHVAAIDQRLVTSCAYVVGQDGIEPQAARILANASTCRRWCGRAALRRRAPLNKRPDIRTGLEIESSAPRHDPRFEWIRRGLSRAS
jgi:hypothetical protein